jgi:hypothetical protein
LNEIRKLRGQLTTIVNSVFPGIGVYIDPKMAPPSSRLQKHLWRIVLSAYGDQVHRARVTVLSLAIAQRCGPMPWLLFVFQ